MRWTTNDKEPIETYSFWDAQTVTQLREVNVFYCFYPLSPGIIIQILLTGLHAFHRVLIGRT